MTGNNGTTMVNNGSTSTLEMGPSNQDLLTLKNTRKKRMWIIASLVGLLVVALVIAAIVLLTTTDDQHADEVTAESLNLEDFLNYRYNPKTFNGTWVSGSKLIFTDSTGDLILYNLPTGETSTLLAANDSIMLTAFDFKISADQQYLLVVHDYQKLYRHSYRASYTIINLSNNNRTVLQADETITGLSFFLVEWAPQGNALVYVYKNNIFYKPSAESENVIAITNTSETQFIYNGIPDWVYEEEIFSSNKALWFSEDGTKIAYARFDDTNVEAMVVPVYGHPGNLYFQYPRANLVKYPKAGTTNPTVSLFVYNIAEAEVTELETTSSLRDVDHILSSVTWATNNSLVAVWMNRVQNHSDVVVYEQLSSTPTIVKTIEETAGWVELFVPPKVSESGTQIALLMSKDEGTTLGSYRHLALLDVQSNATEEFLTSGTYVVTEILGWNHENNQIYYTATELNNSAVQHVYSISPTTKTITCLTCELTSRNGDDSCLYNSAEVSTDSTYLVITCNGPGVPHISIYSASGTEVLEWTVNEELNTLLAGKTLYDKEIVEFEIADGFTGRALLKLPPNMDRSGETKYPMLVNVYGGPDTFQVTEKFSIDWGSYLAANKSIIYATIDGRGSGLRGNNLLFSGYRKLGTVEVVDQINMTKLIQKNLDYVDSTRTGIWGWSYGGYAAGMALATDTEDVLKCGISVAPVTDWALYDSIYTERFMGLPTSTDNLQGYENAQLLTKYAGLKDKDYFLIHGTFDDNVHYQQSMMWAKMLERNDILFRQLSYTDEDHSLSSVRPHLYHSLESFLNECFTEES